MSVTRSRSYNLYVRGTALAGAAVLLLFLAGIGVPRADWNHILWSGPMILLILYVASTTWIIRGLEGGAVMSVSPVFLLTLLLVAGNPLTAVAIVIQSLYLDVLVRRIRDERIFFNVGQSILSVAVAGWVYSRIGGLVGPVGENSLETVTWSLPLQLGAAHLAYLLTNTGFCTLFLALRDKRSAWRYWRANYLPMIPGSFSTPLCAYILARLFLAHQFTGIILFFGLLLLDFIHVREKVAILRSRNRAVDTLLAISGASKPYSHEESAERVALAHEMGRHMGLSQRRMEVLHDAVLLHNVGYVGVDPLTLKRKGALTEDEAGIVRKHPLIGARILLRVPSLREVAWVVLCHHETPDGKGYPLALNAGEAPAEAYIVATVEGFCALKFGRDHQEAMGSEKAFEKIAALAGTRYDRGSVAALARALELPVPPGLVPYLHAKPSKGDLNLKRHHLNAMKSPQTGLSTESLRLYASLHESDSRPSLGALIQGADTNGVSLPDRFRGRFFVASLSMFTLAVLLMAQELGPLASLSVAARPLLWASLVFLASLLVIRLPAGASFTAGSSVAVALALIDGPLAGGLAGALAGIASYILTAPADEPSPGSRARKRKNTSDARRAAPPRSHEILDVPSSLTSRRRAGFSHASSNGKPAFNLSRQLAVSSRFRMALTYGIAAASAGLVFQLCGGRALFEGSAPDGGAAGILLSALAAVLSVLVYAAFETTAVSLWPPRSEDDLYGRGSILDFREWESVLVNRTPLSPPLPRPLNSWERWRDNYRSLIPEPLAYPAAGLLMALAYFAIGPWAVAVVFVYPVFWSHLRLEERLRLSDCRLRLLLSISQAIDERHHYTQGHSLRVGLWAGAIARELGYPENYSRDMRLAGVLHDLGKASWTDAMLQKPRKLTPQENRLKEEHPVLSALVARASFPQVETAILQHHEDWDGTGYPHRVEGPRMDCGASILRVADTLDAISSGRPYKEKEGRKDPIEEILRYTYSDFDPAPAAALASMFGRVTRPGRRRSRGGVIRLPFLRTAIDPRALQALLVRIGEACNPAARPAYAALAQPAFVRRRVASQERRQRHDHGHRVAAFADFLARHAPMSGRERRSLQIAALCHYRGQGLTPDAWAASGFRLTLADLERIAREPAAAARALFPVGARRLARLYIRNQNERWDGTGRYGMRGEEIPLGSRVLALACALERLLAPRPYRRSLSLGAAAEALAARSGTVFDPRLTELLVSLIADSGESTLLELGIPASDLRLDVDKSSGLLPREPVEVRGPRERLEAQCTRLRAWALDLGAHVEDAELLIHRYELSGGKGPAGLEREDVPPLIARFQLEMLFHDVLRHLPRPLTSAVIGQALERMEMFGGWAVSPDEIARFQRDVRRRGLPHTIALAEWDRLTGEVELGGERARDEALLFAYMLWAEGAAQFAETDEAIAGIELREGIPAGIPAGAPVLAAKSRKPHHLW